MIIESYKKGSHEFWLIKYNNVLHYFYNMRQLTQWLGTTKGDI